MTSSIVYLTEPDRDASISSGTCQESINCMRKNKPNANRTLAVEMS